MSTPVEPATGSTISAAMVAGSCSAMSRLAARVGIPLQIMGVRQMIDTRQERSGPHLAVAGDAADRDAPESHAMVGALPADEPRARRLAPRPMIGERDLERGVDRLRAGVGEEHAIEARRCDLRDGIGQ